MAVAKVIEIISGSKVSFDDALKQGIARVSDSLNEVTGAWIKDQRVVIEKGKIVEYRVVMKATFLVQDKPKATARKK